MERYGLIAFWGFIGILAFGLSNRPARPGIEVSLRAAPNDPVYTTLAADQSRSEYMVDEGYHVDYDTRTEPLRFTTDTAGTWSLVWKLGPQVVRKIGDYYKLPHIDYIFPDMVVVTFWPFTTLEVQGIFFVYSSRTSILDLVLTLRDTRAQVLDFYTEFEATEGEFRNSSVTDKKDGVVFGHHEPPKRWFQTPLPGFESDLRDLVLFSKPLYGWAGYPRSLEEHLGDLERDFLSGGLEGTIRAWRTMIRLNLEPNQSVHLRVVRTVQPRSEPMQRLMEQARMAMAIDLKPFLEENRRRLARIPTLRGVSSEDWMVYLSAFNLMRQVFLPPEGRTSYNYYVFSREPTWGWGHEGQVFHESITMMAYAYLDPASAMDSQRVFIERQEPNGYIPYRLGPYVSRTFPVAGESTTASPFFSWVNWSIYQISRDRSFLREAYEAGRRFIDFWRTHRDKDRDGLFEWGGHAVLESVRDAFVAIWDLLGGDPQAPSRVDALDLNCMMVKEMKALAAMAQALGLQEDARRWTNQANELARKINTMMWDPETKFYYHVHRDTHTFQTPDGEDLRRMEIIGFLPLWAGIVPEDRLPHLIRHLTNPEKFWRRYGVPTVAADDPSYNPFITQCCQWNGAIWLLWQYMVFEGLMAYGQRDLAEALFQRNLEAVKIQLRRTHRFWETYSPDYTQLRGIYNYIWDGIIARMFVMLYGS